MIIDSLKITSNPATDGTASTLRNAVRQLCYELNIGATYPDWKATRNHDGSISLESGTYFDKFTVGALGKTTLMHEVDTGDRKVVDEIDLDENLPRPTLHRDDISYGNGYKDMDLSDTFFGGLDETTASGLVLRIQQLRGEVPVPQPRGGN